MPWISVKVDEELKQAINKKLAGTDVSRSQFVRAAIKYHIVRVSTLPGPADADRPLVVTIQNGDK